MTRLPDPWHNFVIAARDVLRYVLEYDPPGEAVGGEVAVDVQSGEAPGDEVEVRTDGGSDADVA